MAAAVRAYRGKEGARGGGEAAINRLILPKGMIEGIRRKVRDLAEGFDLGVLILFERDGGSLRATRWFSAIGAAPVTSRPRDFDVLIFFGGRGGHRVDVGEIIDAVKNAVYLESVSLTLYRGYRVAEPAKLDVEIV